MRKRRKESKPAGAVLARWIGWCLVIALAVAAFKFGF
jgi:hypothetical protein